MLREFGRVLKPRGIAAFAEPGPRHSTTPQSQYEMRTYGVVEADIDIHAIWDAAKRLGFIDVKLAAFHVPPFHMTLDDYEDLLAGGETLGRWAAATRTFLGGVRTFFLTKAGEEQLDSRRAEGLRAVINAIVEPARAGSPLTLHITVRNAGKARWLEAHEPHGGVTLRAHLYDAGGRLLDLDYGHADLPFPLAPGDEVSFDAVFPPLDAGRYILELDCVAEKVTWFARAGSTPTRVAVDVQ